MRNCIKTAKIFLQEKCLSDTQKAHESCGWEEVLRSVIPQWFICWELCTIKWTNSTSNSIMSNRQAVILLLSLPTSLTPQDEKINLYQINKHLVSHCIPCLHAVLCFYRKKSSIIWIYMTFLDFSLNFFLWNVKYSVTITSPVVQMVFTRTTGAGTLTPADCSAVASSSASKGGKHLLSEALNHLSSSASYKGIRIYLLQQHLLSEWGNRCSNLTAFPPDLATMSLYLLIQIWQPCPLISIATSGIAGVGTYPSWDTTSAVGLFLLLFVWLLPWL